MVNKIWTEIPFIVYPEATMEALIYFWKNIISKYIFAKQPLSNFDAEIETF